MRRTRQRRRSHSHIYSRIRLTIFEPVCPWGHEVLYHFMEKDPSLQLLLMTLYNVHNLRKSCKVLVEQPNTRLKERHIEELKMLNDRIYDSFNEFYDIAERVRKFSEDVDSEWVPRSEERLNVILGEIREMNSSMLDLDRDLVLTIKLYKRLRKYLLPGRIL